MPVVESIERVEMWCDGSCLKPGEHGAWAYLIRFPEGEELRGVEAVEATTNNRMEMAAVLYGLGRLMELGHNLTPITVYCDSQYVINGLKEWLPNWKRNNWRTANNKPVKNQSIWEKLDELAGAFADLRFVWVRGHDGNEGNEIVDKMCHRQAKLLRGDLVIKNGGVFELKPKKA